MSNIDTGDGRTYREPPKEITMPPDGYEWTGEYRQAQPGEYYAHYRFGKWDWQRVPPNGEEFSASRQPILRKSKPPTVTLENVPREWAEQIVERRGSWNGHHWNTVRESCIKALENEE